MGTKGKKSKTYTFELKMEAMRLRELGYTNPQIAEKLNIADRDRVKVWWRNYRKDGEAAFIDKRGRQMDTSNSEQLKDVITERLLSNSTYFIEHEISGIINYSLNIVALKTALKSSPMEVLPAGGSASREFFTY